MISRGKNRRPECVFSNGRSFLVLSVFFSGDTTLASSTRHATLFPPASHALQGPTRLTPPPPLPTPAEVDMLQLGVTGAAALFLFSRRSTAAFASAPHVMSLSASRRFFFPDIIPAREVMEGGKKEQGGRVYAFSPSWLIINVSQVHKIASTPSRPLPSPSRRRSPSSPSNLPPLSSPSPPPLPMQTALTGARLMHCGAGGGGGRQQATSIRPKTPSFSRPDSERESMKISKGRKRRKRRRCRC